MSANRPPRSTLAHFRTAVIGVAIAIFVSGCAAPEKNDETRGWARDKLYSEATDALQGGDYTKAARYFETFEARYPFGPQAQQAQINTAYAYYRDNEPASALAAADRFIQLHPNHPDVDYAWYLKGLINFNDNLGWLGRLSGQDLSERDPKAARSSFEAFRTLVMRFPDSKYTPDAKLRMQYIVNSLALHEVHAARYYLSRGAYIAAVNRAQQAVRDYQGAPAVEEALFIMARAYEAMKMNELRDDTMRVLKQNYPSSEFLTSGNTGTSKKAWWQIW